MNQDPTPLGPPPIEDPLVRSLRGALAREADAVAPSRDGLSRIQTAIDAGERGAGRAGRRRLVVLLAAASVVVVGGVVTAAVTRTGQDRGPNPVDPATSSAVTPTPQPGLPVYYPGVVGKGYGVFREFHPIPAGSTAGPAERLQQAITQAMSQRPNDPDYVTLWAAGADARTTLSAHLITIELNEAAAGGTTVAGSSADAIAIQQLIWTATAAVAPTQLGDPAAPQRVRIHAAGPTPDRFGAISLAQPFQRGARPGTGEPRAPVWIDSLGQDATVRSGPLTVQGQAVGGPSALRWTLTQAGAPMASGTVEPTTSSGGSLGVGVRGIWTITLDLPATGRYTLTVSQTVADGGSDSKDFLAN